MAKQKLRPRILVDAGQLTLDGEELTEETAAERNREQMPDAVEPGPEGRRYSYDELNAAWVAGASGDAFEQVVEDILSNRGKS